MHFLSNISFGAYAPDSADPYDTPNPYNPAVKGDIDHETALAACFTKMKEEIRKSSAYDSRITFPSPDLLTMWKKQYLADYAAAKQKIQASGYWIGREKNPNIVRDSAEGEVGFWEEYLWRTFDRYLTDQEQKYLQATVQNAKTEIISTRADLAKQMLEFYGKILKEKGHLLSMEEKEFLKKVYLDFDNPATATEQLKAAVIYNRLYGGEAATQVKIDYDLEAAIQKAKNSSLAVNQSPYSTELALATEEGYDMIRNMFMQTQPRTVLTTVKNDSNAVNWSDASNQQKLATQINDAARVSPLQTAFLKAGEMVKEDLSTVHTTLVSDTGDKNKQMLMYAVLAFAAYKLLRR